MAKRKDIKTKKSDEPPVSGELYHPLSPFAEMDRWMENMLRHRWPRFSHEEWAPWRQSFEQFERPLPRVDVVDEDNQVIVTAEIPGMKKEDLEISVIQDRVTIKGVTSHETKSEKGEYYRREISRGEFSRSVALPAEVDAANAKASFENGMLTVTLPKLAQAKRLSIKVE